MKFQIVDAFTDKIFGGNPAGIAILPQTADFPDDGGGVALFRDSIRQAAG